MPRVGMGAEPGSAPERANRVGANSFYYKWLCLALVIGTLGLQTDAKTDWNARLARNCSWMVSYVVNGKCYAV
jgi:hypothetical protein